MESLLATTLTAGTWAELDREWKDGDQVELSIDMPLRLVPLDPQHTNLVSLLRGPVALFAIEQGSKSMTQKQMLEAQRVGSSGDWEVETNQGKILMKAYPAIKNERYRLYQQT